MLREPGRELVELFNRQRTALTWPMFDRRNSEHPLINSLTTTARIPENAFQELKLVQSGSRLIRCPLRDEVLLSAASNNRISSTRPSVYLDWVIDAAGADINDWLASNLISAEAFEAARADDYDEFLRLRAETIQVAVFPKAGWEI